VARRLVIGFRGGIGLDESAGQCHDTSDEMESCPGRRENVMCGWRKASFNGGAVRGRRQTRKKERQKTSGKHVRKCRLRGGALS
jgi:hypothetical protein